MRTTKFVYCEHLNEEKGVTKPRRISSKKSFSPFLDIAIVIVVMIVAIMFMKQALDGTMKTLEGLDKVIRNMLEYLFV